MSVIARERALYELRLFGIGVAGGIALLLFCLFVLPGGAFLFIGLATRVEYAVVCALVLDMVLYAKEPGLPRRLPATALACGAVLPMVAVSLWIMLRFLG